MPLSVFSSPSAHGVECLSAKFKGLLTAEVSGDFAALSIYFHGQGGALEQLSIYARPEMATKLERLANAVNQIFGEPK